MLKEQMLDLLVIKYSHFSFRVHCISKDAKNGGKLYKNWSDKILYLGIPTKARAGLFQIGFDTK